MKLNIEAAKKIKAELGNKTKLSYKQIAELEVKDPTGDFFVPKDYEAYTNKVQMIRIAKNIKVYFIPLVSKPEDSPDIMWIIEER